MLWAMYMYAHVYMHVSLISIPSVVIVWLLSIVDLLKGALLCLGYFLCMYIYNDLSFIFIWESFVCIGCAFVVYAVFVYWSCIMCYSSGEWAIWYFCYNYHLVFYCSVKYFYRWHWMDVIPSVWEVLIVIFYFISSLFYSFAMKKVSYSICLVINRFVFPFYFIEHFIQENKTKLKKNNTEGQWTWQ